MGVNPVEIRGTQTDTALQERRSEESTARLGDEEKETLLQSQPQVMCRGPDGILQGTLLLTNNRLALVPSSKTDNRSSGVVNIEHAIEKSQLSIPLDSVVSVSGQRGILRISLTVIWHDQPGSSSTTRTEFLQRYRPQAGQKAINEWIPLIEKEATGQTDQERSESADLTELESRVMETLDDTNWKGFFQLERELGEEGQTSIDPDDLDAVLAKLVRDKVIEQDKVGEFYKKISSEKKPFSR